MTAIRPTIATGVLFYPTTSFAAEQGIAVRDIGEPLDAQVTRVHSDCEVDLLVIDLEGKKHKVLRVDFVQSCSQAPEGDGGQVSANYCIPSAARGREMVRFFLSKGDIVKVNGIPLLLEHDALVSTHPGNVPLVFEKAPASSFEESSSGRG